MRAVLWCNGDSPNSELVSKLLHDATLFGIDGGADKAIAAGFEVSEVLGDLDSVDIVDWKGQSTLLSDDSSSDLAKSFVIMSERGFTEVDVVGIDGGSSDHILGTWAALTEAPSGLQCNYTILVELPNDCTLQMVLLILLYQRVTNSQYSP